MPFALTIASGMGRGRRFLFEARSISIGRAADNDVVLNDLGVSRTHARIERKASGWVLSDRASANGLELNGATVIAAAPLREGDRIAVGPVTFEFRLPPAKIVSPSGWWTRVSRPARAGLVALAVLLAGIGALCTRRSERPASAAHSLRGAGAARQASAPARSTDPNAGRTSYERGRRKLAERRVSPRNLYDAWIAFTAARDQLDEGDPLAAEVARLAAECERDLRRDCERLLFAAARFERYGQQEKAQQAWREILLHYPADDPAGCRRKAEEGLLSSQPDPHVE